MSDTRNFLMLLMLLTFSTTNAQFLNQPVGRKLVPVDQTVTFNCSVSSGYIIDWDVTFPGGISPFQAANRIFNATFLSRNFSFVGVGTTSSTLTFDVFETGSQTNNGTIIRCIAQNGVSRTNGSEAEVIFVQTTEPVQITRGATPEVSSGAETTSSAEITTTTKASGNAVLGVGISIGILLPAVAAIVLAILVPLIYCLKKCQQKLDKSQCFENLLKCVLKSWEVGAANSEYLQKLIVSIESSTNIEKVEESGLKKLISDCVRVDKIETVKLLQQLTRIKEDYETNERRLVAAEAEVAQMKGQVAGLETALTNNSEENKKLKQVNQQQQENIAKMKEEKKTDQRSIVAAKAEVAEMKEKVVKLETELTKLKQNNQQQQKDKEVNEGIQQTANKEVAEMKAKVTQSKKDLEAKEKEVTQLKDEFKAKVTQLENEFKARVAQVEEDNKAMTRERDEAMELASQLLMEINKMKQQSTERGYNGRPMIRGPHAPSDMDENDPTTSDSGFNPPGDQNGFVIETEVELF